MPNNINLFKVYIDILDEVYKQASKTSMLESPPSITRAGAKANEIVIPKISMDGLADYDRNAGYKQGAVTLEEETVKFDYDRGRKFIVDAMDNQETAGVAFGQLASEFIRTKVVPEMDSVRFASIAGTAGVTVKQDAVFSSADALMKAISEAITALDEAEVADTNRYLFINPVYYNTLLNLETYKSKELISDLNIVKVPQSRFYSKIDLLSGGESEEAGGYKKADDGANINFMLLDKNAIIQYTKHTVEKVVSPMENQTADAWMFFYRAYGLTKVYENKVKGVYVSTAAE